MSATKQIVTKARISWEADHEQYWQGHGVAFSDYDLCATGCGESLRDAFEDALEDLAQQDVQLTEEQEKELLADLQDSVRESSMIDTSIVEAYCDKKGKHDKSCEACLGNGDVQAINDDCENCDGTGVSPFEYDSEPDCAVCAGEWHFYVNIDVEVAGE